MAPTTLDIDTVVSANSIEADSWFGQPVATALRAQRRARERTPLGHKTESVYRRYVIVSEADLSTDLSEPRKVIYIGSKSA